MKAHFEKTHNYVLVNDLGTAIKPTIEDSFKSRKVAENYRVKWGGWHLEVMTRRQFTKLKETRRNERELKSGENPMYGW